MRRGGFTLIECLLGLALSLLVVSAGLESFARTRKAFAGLKAREEADQAALAALDRMRIDLLHAGRGLVPEMGLGLVAAAETDPAELRLMSVEKELHLAAEAGAGGTRLPLISTADIVAGQRIALREGAAGEVRTVVRLEPGAVVLDAPLERAYAPETAALSPARARDLFPGRAGPDPEKAGQRLLGPAAPRERRRGGLDPGPVRPARPRPSRTRGQRSPSP